MLCTGETSNAEGATTPAAGDPRRLEICGMVIEWSGGPCPHDLAVFARPGSDEPPALTVDAHRVDELPPLPEPDFVTGVTAAAVRDGILTGWNVYERMPDGTAHLAFDGARATILVGPRTWECSVLNMVMLALLPAAARRDALLLHASLVEYDGRAVAFTAASGTGKSTHADLWAAHLGAQIMNGDRAFVRRRAGGWDAYGSPWSGSSPYVRDVAAPLAAVVVLEQGPKNRIRRLSSAELLGHLYNNVRYPFWDEAATQATLATLDALMREMPIYLLSCLPDAEAAITARDAVFGA